MSSQKKRHRRKFDDETKISNRASESPKAKQLADVVVEKPSKMIESIDLSKEETKAERKKKSEAKQNANAPPEVASTAGEKSNGNESPIDVIVIADEPEVAEDKLEPELEPLVVDGDDPELQFDVVDEDSFKRSPSVNRCVTRRSQTRNIPTPITPKSLCETNGEDITAAEQTNGINDGEMAIDTQLEEASPPKKQQIEKHIQPEQEQAAAESVCDGFQEETSVNTSRLSTEVNIGNDTLREIDNSLLEENSFLNTAKDLSLVETLKRISSRRAIRSGNADYRRTLLKTQAQRHEMMLQQALPSITGLTGSKRKARSKTPEATKRFKAEPPSGFLSYLTSPIASIRSRWANGTDCVSASTPKLTSYREQEVIDDPELSGIKESKPADKKRCSIM